MQVLAAGQSIFALLEGSLVANKSVLEDPLLSPQEVCDYLGISIRSYYNMRSEGRPLPRTIKIGKHLRVRASDLKAYLDAQTEPSAAVR